MNQARLKLVMTPSDEIEQELKRIRKGDGYRKLLTVAITITILGWCTLVLIKN